MKKPTVKTVIIYLTALAAMFLSNDGADGLLSFGVYIGAVYSINPVVAALFYIGSSAVYGVDSLIFAGVRTAVISLFLLLHKLVKKKINKWLLLLYTVAANVFYCIYGVTGYEILFDRMLNSLIGIAFSFVCVYFMRAVFTRGLLYRPAIDELVCIAVFMGVVAYRMRGVTFGPFDLLAFLAPYAILFILYTAGDCAGLIAAAVAASGAMLSQGQAAEFAVYVITAVAALTAERVNRYAGAAALVVVDVIAAYFFQVYGKFDVYVLLPFAVSAAAFCLTPAKALNYVRDVYGMRGQKFAGRSVVNKLRRNLSRKLFRLSDVFGSMKSTFCAMAPSVATAAEAENALVREVCDRVCADCRMRGECWRRNMESTEKSFLRLAACALDRKKATILDIDASLSVKCDRLNSVLAEVNSEASRFGELNERAAETGNNRLLIGEQLGGVSKIMRNLAADCKGKISFDSEKEKEIIERLVFHNILCDEAVFIEQNGVMTVIVTVAAKDVDSAAITQIVSGVVKRKMFAEKIEPSENPYWMTVYLEPEARFQLTYGLRNIPKKGSDASGDTHSFIKIEGGKFLVALCDGMGSGENAEKMSSATINLVENFYRAGFDNEVILSCVNKLLAGFNTDSFTAVDICVADLFNGLTDFIKLGASYGIVKCGAKTEIISGSSLPLGVLDEMRPSVTKKALQSGDMFVMGSDGFFDCFVSPDEVCDVFSSSKLTNPQTVADELMEAAMDKCGDNPKDDVTVIVARVV